MQAQLVDDWRIQSKRATGPARGTGVTLDSVAVCGRRTMVPGDCISFHTGILALRGPLLLHVMQVRSGTWHSHSTYGWSRSEFYAGMHRGAVLHLRCGASVGAVFELWTLSAALWSVMVLRKVFAAWARCSRGRPYRGCLRHFGVFGYGIWSVIFLGGVAVSGFIFCFHDM